MRSERVRGRDRAGLIRDCGRGRPRKGRPRPGKAVPGKARRGPYDTPIGKARRGHAVPMGVSCGWCGTRGSEAVEVKGLQQLEDIWLGYRAAHACKTFVFHSPMVCCRVRVVLRGTLCCNKGYHSSIHSVVLRGTLCPVFPSLVTRTMPSVTRAGHRAGPLDAPVTRACGCGRPWRGLASGQVKGPNPITLPSHDLHGCGKRPKQ